MDYLHFTLIVITIIAIIVYKLYKYRFTCKCGDTLEKYDTIYKSADPPFYLYVMDRFDRTAQIAERQHAVYRYKCDGCARECAIDAYFKTRLVSVGQPIPMQLCTTCKGSGMGFLTVYCMVCGGLGFLKKN